MCNREISSRRIDWFFPRSFRTIRGRSPGGRTTPPPPDRPRYDKCPDRARVNTRPVAGGERRASQSFHVIAKKTKWIELRTSRTSYETNWAHVDQIQISHLWKVEREWRSQSDVMLCDLTRALLEYFYNAPHWGGGAIHSPPPSS